MIIVDITFFVDEEVYNVYKNSYVNSTRAHEEIHASYDTVPDAETIMSFVTFTPDTIVLLKDEECIMKQTF